MRTLLFLFALAGAVHAQDDQSKQDLADTLKGLNEVEGKLEEELAGLQQRRAEETRVTIDATFYTHYSYSMEKADDDRNAFEVTRGYFTGSLHLENDWSARLTLETRRDDTAHTHPPGTVPDDPPDDSELEIFYKYAYAEYGGFADASITGGLIKTPWVGLDEDLWGYRMQGSVFSAREGYLTSADLGIGFRRDLFENYGEYHVAIVNGEGFRNPEAAGAAGKFKAAQARITIVPRPDDPFLTGLKIHQFIDVGQYASGELRVRELFAVTFHTEYYRVGLQYLWAKDPEYRMSSVHPSLSTTPSTREETANGFNIWGHLSLGMFGAPEEFAVVGRFDQLDPSDKIARDSHYRGILGVSYRASKNTLFLLDWERTVYEEADGRADESTLFLHFELKL